MSEFLIVTDAHSATLDDLVVTHKSLVVSGSKDIKWFIYGAVPDAIKLLQRRWSFRRVRVVATVDDFKTSDFVIFLNAGDGLYRESLVSVRETIRKNAAADLIYGDSAHPTGVKAEPLSFVRRPGWSPERLRGHCYVGETLVARTQVVERAGGITDLVGRNVHDRALRLSENAKNIVRMPELLTMAKNHDSRPSASLQAVVDHCARQKINADCEFEAAVPSVRVKRNLTTQPSVAVIVPTRGTSAEVFGSERVLVVEAVRSLFEKSTYQNFEVVVVADTPTPQTVLDTLREIGGARLKTINYDRPFNFA